MTKKMNKTQLELMARKYRYRSGDALFVDAVKLREAGLERYADLAKQIHDDMWKLIRALEEHIS